MQSKSAFVYKKELPFPAGVAIVRSVPINKTESIK
jgi:hypothetical protein